MRLHETLVQKLIKVYEVNSGWTEERKLIAALRNLDFSVYVQENGNKVLVDSKDLAEAFAQFNAADNRQERVHNMVEEAKRINEG